MTRGDEIASSSVSRLTNSSQRQIGFINIKLLRSADFSLHFTPPYSPPAIAGGGTPCSAWKITIKNCLYYVLHELFLCESGFWLSPERRVLNNSKNLRHLTPISNNPCHTSYCKETWATSSPCHPSLTPPLQ